MIEFTGQTQATVKKISRRDKHYESTTYYWKKQKSRRIQLKNELKDLYYHNKEKEDLSVETNLKEGAQQNGPPIQKHLQEQVAKGFKRLIKNG